MEFKKEDQRAHLGLRNDRIIPVTPTITKTSLAEEGLPFSEFESILFVSGQKNEEREKTSIPHYFVDLNIDQIVDAVCAGKEQYNLKPFFYAAPASIEAISYRQEIMRDLEEGAGRIAVDRFASKMNLVRDCMVNFQKLRYKRQKERVFLDTVKLYCTAVRTLDRELAQVTLRSRGLTHLRNYLAAYVSSDEFITLEKESNVLRIRTRRSALYSRHSRSARGGPRLLRPTQFRSRGPANFLAVPTRCS